MRSIGVHSIYLTGSKKSIKRAVRVDEDNKCYIMWYGKLIEVEIGICNGFRTVDYY